MKNRMQQALALVIVSVSACSAYAQNTGVRDAGSKIRNGGMANGVQMYQRHAQDRSQMLYYYYRPQAQQSVAAAPTPIPKAKAQELVPGIRKDLTNADKALDELKAMQAKNAEAVKLIASIEKHHAKAREVCEMTEAECSKDDADHVNCANCCSDMWYELDAARAETAKLMKLLNIENLDPPKKVTAKKDAVK